MSVVIQPVKKNTGTGSRNSNNNKKKKVKVKLIKKICLQLKKRSTGRFEDANTN